MAFQEHFEKLRLPGVRRIELIHLDGYSLDSLDTMYLSLLPEHAPVMMAALCSAARAVGGLFAQDSHPEKLHLQDRACSVHFYWMTGQHVLVLQGDRTLEPALLDGAVCQIQEALVTSITHSSGPEIIRFGDGIELADLSSIPFD